MKIAIDLSSLQGPHRMRGIGYTLINFINNISKPDKERHSFVFYFFDPKTSGMINPLEIIELSGINYEVRHLTLKRRINYRLPGRLNMFIGALNQLREIRDFHRGDSRLTNLNDVDFFLQTDQSQCLPSKRNGTRTGLIIYDIIPYVLEWDYLWNYRTARAHAFTRKAALRVKVRRWLYAHKVSTNIARADLLIAISEHTKEDFIRHLSVPREKIIVCPLGVSKPLLKSKNPSLKRYQKTSWGYIPRPFTIDASDPFLLFVGGADRRRKLGDLVGAYNILRAQGYKIKLVLAGDSMQGPENISTEEIQSALTQSSYLSEIIFLGFTDDATRNWLYNNALAFVFPSKYEGFGLPVLEAMIDGCPVIAYENAATREVAGTSPLYAHDALTIASRVRELLDCSSDQLATMRARNKEQAESYSWNKTSDSIIDAIQTFVK